MNEIIPFFTSIFVDDIDYDHHKAVGIMDYSKKTASGAIISNCGGYQSIGFIPDKNDPLCDLYQKITNEVSKIYNLYHIQNEPVIANAWYNINGYDNYNKSHRHPNSYFSVVYYPYVPQGESGTIVFTRPDLLTDYIPSTDYNERNYQEFFIQPTTGTLLIFPSYLTHFVNPNKTNEYRYSIAINYRG
jgi:uncharacterized protein (TIGR02466 family)